MESVKPWKLIFWGGLYNVWVAECGSFILKNMVNPSFISTLTIFMRKKKENSKTSQWFFSVTCCSFKWAWKHRSLYLPQTGNLLWITERKKTVKNLMLTVRDTSVYFHLIWFKHGPLQCLQLIDYETKSLPACFLFALSDLISLSEGVNY